MNGKSSAHDFKPPYGLLYPFVSLTKRFSAAGQKSGVPSGGGPQLILHLSADLPPGAGTRPQLSSLNSLQLPEIGQLNFAPSCPLGEFSTLYCTKNSALSGKSASPG
ncbi:hypothetical protein AVEN_265816-1 [Araneus ventricosus]|uniref:Uncharacterized protein n=1 Tax=Araneus ventricosus TaxID=182803 RepID=A0A4Y2DWT5_ARAVE|nr:hypothetical protein AVEN_265816-1 [Araneus ventricosus]